MDEQKEKALAKLSRAFRSAKEAGLVFFGMDGSLLALDVNDYKTDQDLTEYGNNVELVTVNTHKTYKDSGGW